MQPNRSNTQVQRNWKSDWPLQGQKRKLNSNSSSCTGNLRPFAPWLAAIHCKIYGYPSFRSIRSDFILFLLFYQTKRWAYHKGVSWNCLLCKRRKKIIERLSEILGVGLGETTKDGRFTFEITRCIGACGLAPAMMIDNVVYKQVNANKLESILSQY